MVRPYHSAALALALAALLLTATPGQATAEEPGFTHVSPDGNRYTTLKAALPDTEPLDIKLFGKPVWVVGMGNIWAVVLEDDTVQAFRIDHGEAYEINIMAQGISADAPPVLVRDGKGRALLISSGLTSPMPYAREVMEAWMKKGRLYVQGTVSWLTPLPDTRILSDGKGRLLLLTGPTSEFTHSALGDSVEATGFALLESKGKSVLVRDIKLHGPIIEGTSPLWADMDGDGSREIALTISTPDRGAYLAIYSEDGKLLAKSEPVGKRFHWRHQLVVAPFGPDGAIELAAVKTPHINGTVEFFAFQDGALVLTAELSGYSSHKLGSRNLDMAAAGDLDSDGRVELLVPTRDFKRLVGLRRSKDGIEKAWRLDLPGKLTTNMAVIGNDGRAALGVGTDKKILRLWLP